MPETANREKDIFLKALDLPSPAEQAAFLDEACGADGAMRRQIEAMLQAHSAQDSFLEKPAAALSPTIDQPPQHAAEDDVSERPGTRIGSYKLLQQIGEGGMGVVWMAEQQEPVRRMVAVKIIKPGMDSAQVVARFEAERQALALMDHLNIARVLDAGATPSGRPFFVMELVHGIPIARFCDDHKLTPRQRLELFIPVCRAIQHAHQKGIIHRDIKPSNVLVTMYDDKPVPKVIDIGVAKAIDQRLTEKTLFTHYGALVGTFEYMSPEQAEMNALGVDTRTDIYALGVMIYELLTGTTPLERERVRQAGLQELVRLIKEEEPQQPSVRLSSADTLAKIAAARGTEPARLSQLVRGEIDWIVMKCLEKDRTRRYDTASALARDIERYLGDEPIDAGPPSAAYRLRKFVKRNRGPMTAAAGMLLAIVLGIIGTTWGWLDAIAARKDEADQRKKAVEAISDKAKAEEIARIAAQKRADVEKQRADEAGQRMGAVKAHLAFERGINRLDRGEIGPGLLWLARGLEYAPEDEVELRGSLRRFLGGWGSEAPLVPHAILPGMGDDVHTVVFSPNGKTLVTAARSQDAKTERVQVWNATTLQPIGAAMDCPAAIWGLGLRFSPDSRQFLLLGDDARLLDLETRKMGEPFGVAADEKDGRGVRSAAFSPDGKSVVLCYNQALRARVWDIASGKRKFVLGEPVNPTNLARGACYSADGKSIYTFDDEAIRRWNADTGAEETPGTPILRTGDYVRAVAAANGKRFVLALKDNVAGFLSVNDDKVAQFQGADFRPEQYVNQIALSGDGRIVATSGNDWTIRVWEWAGKKATLSGSLIRHPGPNFWPDLALSPDGKTLATANGSCRLWDVKAIMEPQKTARFVCRQKLAHALAFHPDGKSLWVASEMAPSGRSPAGTVLGVRRWSIETGKEIGEPLTHDGAGVWCLAVSNNGKLLATGSIHDASVRLWDAATSRPVGEVCRIDKGANLRAIAFRPDDREVFALSRSIRGDAPVRLHRWDVKSSTLLADDIIAKAPYEISLLFSPNGAYCAGLPYGPESSPFILDTATAKPVGMPELQFRPIGFAFSPDGKTYLTELRDVLNDGDKSRLRLWETATGKALGESALSNVLRGGWGYADRMAFAPDGRTFAAWQSVMPEQRTSALMFRDAATLKPLHSGSFRPLSEAHRAVFERGGERVAVLRVGADRNEMEVLVVRSPRPSAGDGERIRLWFEVATGQELDAGGGISNLDAKTWQERYDRLQKLGGPP
jgi:serine/threonine protein kinase/WD40 repeat protein